MKNYEQFVNEGKIYDAVKSSLKNLWKKLFKSDPEGLETKRQEITDVLGKNTNEPKQVLISDILKPETEPIKYPNDSYKDFQDRISKPGYIPKQEESYEEFKKRMVKNYEEHQKESTKKNETQKEKESFSKDQAEIKAQLIEIAGNIYTDFMKSKTFKHFSFKKEDDSNQLYYYFTNGNKLYFEFVKGGNTSILIYYKGNYMITYKLNADFTDNFMTAFLSMVKIRTDMLTPKGAKEISINKNIDKTDVEEDDLQKLLRQACTFYSNYIDEKYNIEKTKTKDEQEEIRNNFNDPDKAIEYLEEIEEDSDFYESAQTLIEFINDLVDENITDDKDDYENNNADNRFYK